MAPGAAAARRSCPGRRLRPAPRGHQPSRPRREGGRRKPSLTSPWDAEGPLGAGRARSPCCRRAESPPGLARRRGTSAGCIAALLAEPGRCSAAAAAAAATSCREYFPRLPARPARFRAAVPAALCLLRSPPPGGRSRATACPAL